MCGPGTGADVDPELFFPVGENGPAVLQADEAKAICSVCPVVDACLRGALERREPDGIWGGTTPSERRAMLRAAARTAHRTGEAAA
ncbi:WhiB family transcriptional regulator [Streptomyces uncialis]|uniref:WhiB family transcriptional regulator n=1 Tax=Streptomyces uncialis TaxID=1048205 RepID=UPI00378BD453